jgi:hypothetical protein
MINAEHDRGALVSSLLAGSVDQHVHSGPSVIARELDHLEQLKDASDAGVAAILLKDHYYATGPFAILLNHHFASLGVKVLSGIALNNTVGGFNPHAVEHEALMGGKLVWLPTVSAENHIKNQKAQDFDHPSKQVKLPEPVPVLPFNSDKTIKDEVKQVLDVVAKHDMVLAGGHLHVSEIWTVFEEAKRRGVKRYLINHPESHIQASMNDVGGFVAFGAYIEHSMVRFLPGSKYFKYTTEQLKNHIEAGTVEKTILASDLGVKGAAMPVEGMRRTIELCLDLGYSADAVRAMIRDNPNRLLGVAQ